MSTVSRVQFLRGDVRGKRSAVRPPWSPEETLFVDSCTRCDECVKACPENILSQGRGGFPEVDFARGECTFCGECAAHCKDKVLSRNTNSHEAPWLLKAHISERCLAHSGIVCFTCGEQCEVRAIQFSPRPGGVRVPEIEAGICTGCGACYKPCPVSAIDMFMSTVHDQCMDTGSEACKYSNELEEVVG
jgi:ferredoxin-type protein NapF